MLSRLKLCCAILLVAGLAGCASVPADWGRTEVRQLTAERGKSLPQIPDARTFTDRALRAPLTVESAVQLALINNPDMRREAARLGFAAAEVYEAGRLSNPTFSLIRMSGDSSAGANVPQLTLGLAFNFVNLLFLPANNRYAQAQFEAAKFSVADAAMALAVEVEIAWFEAVGADQLSQMRAAAAEAQQASAELSQRFFDAGNISRRELAMERAAASSATLAAITATARAFGARSDLNRLMGLGASQNTWTLDARLAEPLPEEDDVADLQKLALDSRLDLASLRRQAEAIADRYGVTRRTRFVNGIEVGVERERDYDRAVNAGPTLSIELPLFNWGGGRVAAIQAALDETEAALDSRVLEVSNAVQLGSAKVRATKALAQEYRSALIPNREAVVARAQEEQNFMLIGIFEVILEKQQAYEAYAGYIEAVRDYWTARAELSRAIGRNLPSSDQPARATLDSEKLLEPQESGMSHRGHSMGSMSGVQGGIGMESKSAPGKSGEKPMQHSMPAPTMKSKPHADHGSKAPMSGVDHASPDNEGPPSSTAEQQHAH